MKKIKVMAISLFVLLMFMSGFMARAQSNDADFETFSKYISDLQKNPEDTTLREKIIKLALTLDPAPAIPQEVERFMARGQAAMEIAQEPGDFKDAAAEFEKAALAAPWLGNVYYNLGIVQDKAGDYIAAIRNLKLYLLAVPDASDAKVVETLIYKIEFKQEKAAREMALTPPLAESETTRPIDFSGKWHDPQNSGSEYPIHYEFALDGNRITLIMVYDREFVGNTAGTRQKGWTAELNGRYFSGKQTFYFSGRPVGYPISGTLSEDGSRIEIDYSRPAGADGRTIETGRWVLLLQSD